MARFKVENNATVCKALDERDRVPNGNYISVQASIISKRSLIGLENRWSEVDPTTVERSTYTLLKELFKCANTWIGNIFKNDGKTVVVLV